MGVINLWYIYIYDIVYRRQTQALFYMLFDTTVCLLLSLGVYLLVCLISFLETGVRIGTGVRTVVWNWWFIS